MSKSSEIEQDKTAENNIEIKAESDFSKRSQYSTEICHESIPF